MEIRIDNNYEGRLIRDVLKNELGYSATLIKKLKFSENGILVNGQWVTVRYELKRGDVLTLSVEDKPEDVSPYIIPAALDLPVIYEDEWVTAVNKPYNMPSHPSLGHQLDTVANALAYRYSDRIYVFRPVNRLDRDTSGCMLTSNTKDASYKMYTAMVEGRIHKTYLAVLDGIPEKREGLIESYMHRKPDSIIEREECDKSLPDAKHALSAYRVLSDNGVQCLCAASPLTGRTHQLRLHFRGIGCPVTGDSLYGAASEHIARHALHSWRTVFPHPVTGERITAEAPLPEDIAHLTRTLGLELTPEMHADLSDYWNIKDI